MPSILTNYSQLIWMANEGEGGRSSERGYKVDPKTGISLLNKFFKLQPSKFRGTANPSELD